MNASPPAEMITEYLQSHNEITNTIVRQLTGIGSENQVKTIFKNMITSGALERIPGRSQRYAAYRLPTEADDQPQLSYQRERIRCGEFVDAGHPEGIAATGDAT